MGAASYVVLAEGHERELRELARVTAPSATIPAGPEARRYLVAAISAHGAVGPPAWVGLRRRAARAELAPSPGSEPGARADGPGPGARAPAPAGSARSGGP
ncbi:MAG: hypothetical protein AB7N76_27265 [Planctomycetota bacterium]